MTTIHISCMRWNSFILLIRNILLSWFFRCYWSWSWFIILSMRWNSIWIIWLSVNNLRILSWIYWSYTVFTWSIAWNFRNWFVWYNLIWIGWIILVTWSWSIRNWISIWIYWNDLTNLVVNNCYVCVRIIWSYCLTAGSSNFCNITINYWNSYCAECVTRFTICLLYTS